ncbi:hypothetical protein N0V92_007034 [Colletotrichum tropicale]|nr:hypothetical protein N0V92_007034 [Colletotrichum tropicale]
MRLRDEADEDIQPRRDHRRPPKTTDTANCRVCSAANDNNLDCTSLTSCSPQTTDIDYCRVCSVVDHNNLGCTSIARSKVFKQQHPVMRLSSSVNVWVDGVKVCNVVSGSYLILPETAVAENCQARGKVYMKNNGLTLNYYDKDRVKHSDWTREG